MAIWRRPLAWVVVGFVVVSAFVGVGLVLRIPTANNSQMQFPRLLNAAAVPANVTSFRSSGTIASLVSPSLYSTFSAGNLTNATTEINMIRQSPPPAPKATQLLVGNWSLDVSNGNVNYFSADIDMGLINGTHMHTHSIRNFQSTSLSSLSGVIGTSLDKNLSTSIVGFADIFTNGTAQWKHVPVSIILLQGNTLDIRVDQYNTDNHFGGLPIFGAVQSITDSNGNRLGPSLTKS